MCTEKDRDVEYFSHKKIHFESNSNSSCVDITVVYLLYFLQFREIIGANFCGFALQT